jgi:hypothetical protein
LIAAFADLAATLFEGYMMAKMLKRLLPCAPVEIDGINQRFVDVENGGLRHITP